jgi:hypothetical protein
MTTMCGIDAGEDRGREPCTEVRLSSPEAPSSTAARHKRTPSPMTITAMATSHRRRRDSIKVLWSTVAGPGDAAAWTTGFAACDSVLAVAVASATCTAESAQG